MITAHPCLAGEGAALEFHRIKQADGSYRISNLPPAALRSDGSIRRHSDPGAAPAQHARMRRLLQELGTIRVETMNGIHPVNISVAVGAAHVGGGIPTPDEFIGFTQTLLPAEIGGIADGVWGR